MGLFNDPYSHLGPKESDPVDTNAESRLHRKEAREVARESVVLLKNRLETLPLKKSATIAVVGPLADSKRDVMGSWSAAGVADQSDVYKRQGGALSAGLVVCAGRHGGAVLHRLPALPWYSELPEYQQRGRP